MHGEEIGTYAYGLWTIVAFNIALVLFFAISFINPEKQFGQEFLEYQQRVSMFFPKLVQATH